MVRNVIRLYRRAYVGLPSEIWMLSGALFVNRFGTMVLPFFTLYLTSDLGYQEATAGRMLSVYGLGSISGAYIGGRLIRSVGAIRVQILFLLLAVPMFLAVPLFRSWPGIAVSMFLLGLFSEGIRPANATAITHFAPPELRVRAFGLQRMAVNLGISFGPAMGGVLATISFFWLFVVDAATTLLCALLLIYFFGLRRYSKTEPSARQEATDPGDSVSPLSDPLYLIFLGLLLPTCIVFFQFHATYPLFLRDHYGLTKPMIGLIYAVNTVVIVVFEMLLLNYVWRRSLIPIIGGGCLLSCLGFGILPFGDSVGYCVLSMLVITLGEMLWMPLASGWIAHRGDRGNRGMYMGWYTMTFSLAGVVAPTFGGSMYQRDPSLIWYISIGVGICVAMGFYWLNRLLCLESAASSRIDLKHSRA